ncbi:MAG: hypothetical protein ACTSYM_00455 [Candidatus Baldrarchaeia archaeon]
MAEEEKKDVKDKIKQMLELSEAEYGYIPEEEGKKSEIIEEIMKYLKEAAKKKSKEIKGVV